MKTLSRFMIAILLLISMSVSASAKGKDAPPKTYYRIVEADAVAITVTIGRAGNTHEKFAITDGTKITINGAEAAARDLRAGMMVHVETGSDKSTAKSIEAKDAPAAPRKHRVG